MGENAWRCKLLCGFRARLDDRLLPDTTPSAAHDFDRYGDLTRLKYAVFGAARDPDRVRAFETMRTLFTGIMAVPSPMDRLDRLRAIGDNLASYWPAAELARLVEVQIALLEVDAAIDPPTRAMNTDVMITRSLVAILAGRAVGHAETSLLNTEDEDALMARLDAIVAPRAAADQATGSGATPAASEAVAPWT